MAINHENYLKEYLEKNNKVYLASQLIEILKDKYPSLTEINCRKIISRATNKEMIKSSNPITFGKNQYAYANLRMHFTYENLKGFIRINKRPLYRTIVKLYKENILTENEILKVSGATIKATRNKTSLENIISELKKLQIAEETTYEKIKFFYIPNKLSEELIQNKYKKVLREEMITTMSLNWLNNISMTTAPYSFYKGRSNNYIGIEQSNVIFDAQTFTRSIGFNMFENNNDTIVVIDFNLQEQYEEFDFEGFSNRVQVLINSTQNRKRRVLPIIMAKNYSPKALKLINNSNYLHYNLASIYGNNFEQIIQRYYNVRGKIDDDNKLNEFEEIMVDIGSNINYQNIKGEFFEYIMKSAFEKIYNKSNEVVKRNILESDNNEKYECDIMISTEKEYIFIELKAYNKKNIIMLGTYEEDGKITKNTLKWFLNRTYMYFKQKYSNNPENKKCKCCYITTSSFHKDALKVLVEKNHSKDKPDNIDCYYDYNSLCELLKNNKCIQELKSIKRFF